jgi:TolA-binding protein
MKKNLEHSALPSADEIRLYQEGKLESVRSHEIEVLAQENPLLADALEGYSANPSFAMLPLITQSIAQSSGLASGTIAAASSATTGASATGLGSTAAKVGGTAWWHLNGWVIGVVTGTAAAVGVSVAMVDQEEQSSQKSNDSRPTVSVDETHTPAITNEISEETFVVQPESKAQTNELAKSTTELNEAHSNAASSETSNSQLIKDDTKGGETNQQVLTPITGISPTLQNSQVVSTTEDTPKKSSTVAINIMRVLNYKMADYTAIRASNWEKFSLDEVGLSANFSSNEERKKYLDENPDKSVPYVNYITECIRAYDTEKYDQAIQRFSVVLNEYPDDVNAQFYSAMSYYSIGELNKANELFAKVEKNHINTFDEEALYYNAKSLQQQGLLDDANSLFVRVVQMNGFYKEHAIKDMK